MDIADKQLIFVGVGGVSDAVRLVLPAIELSKKTSEKPVFLRVTQRTNLDDLPKADLVIICRTPSPSLVEYFHKKGAKVIFDQDDNFSLIPEHHPGYKGVGRGNPEYLDALYTAMNMADAITVTNQALYNSLNEYCPKHKWIVPNGWSEEWYKLELKAPKDPGYVYIGWGGTITHREDFKECLPALKRIVKEQKNVKIVIAGDYKIYEYLSFAPENQKMFLPMVPYEMYPYLLSWFDVMLAPLQDAPFNHVKSDIKLIDAGAMAIPWIASKITPYLEWFNHGGVLCSNTEEWFEALHNVVVSRQLVRDMIGEISYEYACEKEMKVLVDEWMKVIDSL